MKQIKSKFLVSGTCKMLTREQLKSVMGGYEPIAGCSTRCKDGSTASISNCGGTCDCSPGVSCTCGGGTTATCSGG